MSFLCNRNRTSWLYPHKGWNQASTKESRGNSCIKAPIKVKDLHRFLGMVQYYWDLWAKHSEMLAPLTDLVGECGFSKLNKAQRKREKPWHWNMEHQKAFDDSKEFEIYTRGSSHKLVSSSLRITGPWHSSVDNWQNARKSTVLLRLNSWPLLNYCKSSKSCCGDTRWKSTLAIKILCKRLLATHLTGFTIGDCFYKSLVPT